MGKETPTACLVVPAACLEYKDTASLFKEYPQRVSQGSNRVLPGVPTACFWGPAACFWVIRIKVLKWVSSERHIRFQVCSRQVFSVTYGSSRYCSFEWYPLWISGKRVGYSQKVVRPCKDFRYRNSLEEEMCAEQGGFGGLGSCRERFTWCQSA